MKKLSEGSLQDLQAKIENDEITLKGEFVIVIEGTEENTFDLNFSNKIKELYLEHLPAKDAAKLISALSNQSKREVYKLSLIHI